MENSFHNRDFERIVKQNADQYRMFPSEKVWKSIHNTIHPRRRWFGFGLALLFVTTAAVTTVMLWPAGHQAAQSIASGRQAGLRLNSNNITPSDIAIEAPVRADVKTDRSTTPSHTGNPTHLSDNFLTATDLAVPGTGDVNTEVADLTPPIEPVTTDMGIRSTPAENHVASAAKTASAKPIASAAIPVEVTSNRTTINEPPRPVCAEHDAKKPEETAKDLLSLPPYTIESVVNTYHYHKNRKRVIWQLYLTPTVSYRSLSENTEFISAARYNSIVNGTTTPVYYSTDVNSVVTHKPDAGFQLGVRAAFPISRWFSFTTGFQLGVSKYDIQAYDHSSEVATIALTGARSGSNTVSTVTNYRNGNGNSESWLRNFYFSASVPLGVELKLSDGSRNYFGVASTLQPTLVLDNRAYLISTDYKNYAEVPSLTRRFNLNTSFEVFSAHTTGKLKWRVGPQVHYQLMSSFVKNYPIKEHLFDFGLKLGITLN